MSADPTRSGVPDGRWRQHVQRRDVASHAGISQLPGERSGGPVGRALCYIERHLRWEITIEEVVGFSGVSRLHLLRAFNAVTGHPMMRYIRARRAGEMKACEVDDQQARVDPPRFEVGARLLIAGLTERHDGQDRAAAAGQWRRFAAYFGNIAGQVGRTAYGTSYYTDEDGSVEYLSGVQVADFSSVPRNFGLLCVPARRCAVFLHRDHISTLRDTWIAIWNQWLPASGHEVADAPFFERFSESFDPLTGLGGAEIWVPIVAGAGPRLAAVPAGRT